MTPEERLRRIADINTAFTPNTPINRMDLFSGRAAEIDRVFGAVFSPGEHAVIYGERGVGKSSLANIIYDVVVATGRDNYAPAKVNCSRGMTFTEVWREIFRQLPVSRGTESFDLTDRLSDNPNSEEIRGLFEELDSPSIIVIDEFDRVDQIMAVQMADTIKTLSDRATETTLVIVGVADSLDQLIEEHQSVTRSIVQVEMPRMSQEELLTIVSNGLTRARMEIADNIPNKISALSRGLPHYTHLLAKHAALAAVKSGRAKIEESDYEIALIESVKDKVESLGKSYKKATDSSRENIFAEVLLACALATDEYGLFSAGDVRIPLGKITDSQHRIQAYIRHLDKFCHDSRGPVLIKTGEIRRFQYKFVEPLMQPYVVIRGLSEGLISEQKLSLGFSSGQKLLF